jgi:hypothetical protein
VCVTALSIANCFVVVVVIPFACLASSFAFVTAFVAAATSFAFELKGFGSAPADSYYSFVTEADSSTSFTVATTAAASRDTHVITTTASGDKKFAARTCFPNKNFAKATSWV